MKNEPLVREYMTLQPQSIEAKESLEAARKVMSMFDIRHLPVTTDGIVTGILSQRELDLGMQIEVIDSKQLVVLDACSERPYIAYPDTPLREVAEVMSREHFGSVIIMENAKLAGIFTAGDACRALAQMIEDAYIETNTGTIKRIRHGLRG